MEIVRMPDPLEHLRHTSPHATGSRVWVSFVWSMLVASFVLVLGALVFLFGTLQAQSPTTPSYEVLSVTPQQVLVRIAPKYQSQVVHDTSGYAYTEMSFTEGVMTDSVGSQGIPRLNLQFLTSTNQPAKVEVVSQSLEVLPNIDLAPVPTYRTKPDGSLLERYIVSDRYYTPVSNTLYEAKPVRPFRTAFGEQITVSPIQYDPATRSVTRVKSLVLRIMFPKVNANPAAASLTISPEEASTFRAVFLNGNESSLYSCAWQQNAGVWARAKSSSSRMEALSTSSDTGKWIQVTTGTEGIYRITAQDLSNAGISGPIDPKSIELLGLGGEMLNESVSDSSGEWIERPVEVHANGSSFSDLYFYAPGITAWKYSGSNSGADGLYRTINPYTSSGHFLLHVGGTPVSSPERIDMQADALTGPAIPSNTVFTSVIHEVDHKLEYGNEGREMLDQQIPIVDQSGQGAPPLQLTLDAPGYAPDSSILLIGWDSQIGQYDGPPASGGLNVQVNGQSMGTLPGRVNTGATIDRDWNEPIWLGPSVQAPINLSLTFTSSLISAYGMLNFVELFYHRTTDIGSQSIPFFVIDTNAALAYQFSNAGGGEVWDVTNSLAPHVAAAASGNSMQVSLQGKQFAMRRFIAFSGQSLLSPTLSAITPPTLRNTVCQTGATEIIVAPQAFLTQANELAQLREEGGQATEAMSAAVVTIEDIYHEFGYGNNDIVALRDFMAYTFHHAQTRPVYLTLLGGGHCDYQNRQTSAPDWLPPYEDVSGPPFPDDGFFVRLTPGNPENWYDLSVGRISVRNTDDAEAYIQKVREYEHSSDTGSWRALATFLADDHWNPDDQYNKDLLDHFFDTQREITNLQDRVLVHKIYEASYPTVISSEGKHIKPTVNKAIIDAFNTGTVLFSFVGHGNPNVWTHEGILNVPSSIEQMTNFDRLAYVTTATCDFSVYDDFNVFSGGELFLMQPNGGAIGLLGTSRSVGGGEPLVQSFYQTLFQQDSGKGTSTVGQALIAGKMNGADYYFFYLLGDPAQRLLLPKLYVAFDSLNGNAIGTAADSIPALSTIQVSGSIRPGSANGPVDETFNGTVNVTLFDSPTWERATSIFPLDSPPDTVTDVYSVEGPILFRGTATVTDGHFNIRFVVPRDVKLDTGAAKFSGYAYSSSDNRTALGDNRAIHLTGSAAASNTGDTAGPGLQVWIGSRMFRSGDAVSRNSTAIVDVNDLHGLNTSTASIGHSFIAWVDDAMDSAIDMASTYVSKPNDFTSGTSIHAIQLPAGHHTLHVRAFNTYDNPTFASVDFVAKNDAPYQLYNVTAVPDPLQDHTIFSFVQPGQAGSLVNITLSLYASDGALVRVLTASSRESVIQIPWDGRDASGTAVADGAYFFNINAQDATDGTSTIASGKCIVNR